jgi:signal transduction histidine kinase
MKMKINLNRLRVNLNHLGLKWKIFVYLLGFCALLLIILWLFQTVFLDSFYRTIKTIEIKSNASTIEENLASTDLGDLLTAISRDIDVSIEILQANGQTLYAVEARKDSPLQTMTPQDKLKLIGNAQNNNGEFADYLFPSPQPSPLNKKGGFNDIFPHNDRTVPFLIYAKLVKLASGEPAAILLSAEISPVNATVATLRYQLYVVTGIMILLAVFLAFIIAKRVSKPIEEINQSAKLLARGNYDTSFNGKGFLEINELSATLNTAAAELSKVESLRRELMANISHDLRTPLALIYSYAEMMHDFPAEIGPEQIQVIMAETERLTSLVNDILDISQLEAGNQELNLSTFNLTEIIRKTTCRLAELTKKDGFDLSFTAEGEVMVCADEVKITQVFYNLLINAIHYTGKDKRITVKQVTAGASVRIEVTDSGAGIAPADLPYIWDRYYKVDKTHKRALTGTGLGLAIVKKVIKLHGGEYGVLSQVGQGSTFWFSLTKIP